MPAGRRGKGGGDKSSQTLEGTPGRPEDVVVRGREVRDRSWERPGVRLGLRDPGSLPRGGRDRAYGLR